MMLYPFCKVFGPGLKYPGGWVQTIFDRTKSHICEICFVAHVQIFLINSKTFVMGQKLICIYQKKLKSSPVRQS